MLTVADLVHQLQLKPFSQWPTGHVSSSSCGPFMRYRNTDRWVRPSGQTFSILYHESKKATVPIRFVSLLTSKLKLANFIATGHAWTPDLPITVMAANLADYFAAETTEAIISVLGSVPCSFCEATVSYSTTTIIVNFSAANCLAYIYSAINVSPSVLSHVPFCFYASSSPHTPHCDTHTGPFQEDTPSCVLPCL